MSMFVIKTPRLKRGAKSFIFILFLTAIGISCTLAALFGHWLGYHQGFQDSIIESSINFNGHPINATQIESLNLQVSLLNNQLQKMTEERDISLHNLNELHLTNENLHVKNLQLQQFNDVLTYHMIKKGGVDLNIIAARIEPLPENAFEYRFDVVMLAPDAHAHSLTPKLTLLNEHSLVEVPLDPSRYMINGISRIRGRFIMPEGFKPKQVKIELLANGQSHTQLYDWQFTRHMTNIPLSLAEVPAIDERPIASID